MHNQDLVQPTTEVAAGVPASSDQDEGDAMSVDIPPTPAEGNEHTAAPPPSPFTFLRGLPPFWHDRLIEAGLILSMGLYYLVGNSSLGAGPFLHIPPYLYSLPFLAIFFCLSWYRLPFAVALLPLALPYYLTQKTVFMYGSHTFDFGLGEISLAICVLVALAQFLLHGSRWRHYLSWRDLRALLGPFSAPILIFGVAALVSVGVAVVRATALRAFREEVFDPLLYVLLALCCLRTRQDLQRLAGAFLGSALIIALVGLVQYFFFAGSLQTSFDGSRARAMYGSANSIGLFFNYALPFGMALLIFQASKALRLRSKWWPCLLLLAGFVPLIGVLVFSQSLGTALALPVALLFILALSVRNRQALFVGVGVLLVLALGTGVVLQKPLTHFIMNWHDNSKGISTLTRRYYLWQSAWHMIQYYPWFGVGMDNWLCHYSLNTSCPAYTTTHFHFWITLIPGTHLPTGLRDEPDLSHPHNIFLQIWVSIGIFGLLAFGAILTLFYWLFARVVKTVRRSVRVEVASLEWLVLGVGGAMLASLCQGLIDSSFLEQDLAFCFWMLVAALLILRVLTGTPWRGK